MCIIIIMDTIIVNISNSFQSELWQVTTLYHVVCLLYLRHVCTVLPFDVQNQHVSYLIHISHITLWECTL